MLLIPLEHCSCWTIAQMLHIFVQKEPLVLATPPVTVGLLQGEPSSIVELPRKPQNGGETGGVPAA